MTRWTWKLDLLCGRKVVVILLAALTRLSLGDYDHTQYPATENFDPAQADPWGNITCYGPPPSYNFPNYQTPTGVLAQPSTWTLQQLCAKPQYGGKGEFQHLGAYCQRYDRYLYGFQPYMTLVFDKGDAAKSMWYLGGVTPRLGQYCAQRCFCNYTSPDASPIDPQQLMAQLQPGLATILRAPPFATITLDLPYPQSDHRPHVTRSHGRDALLFLGQKYDGGQLRHQQRYALLPGSRATEPGEWHSTRDDSGSDSETLTVLSNANMITCSGRMPSWGWWDNIGPLDAWGMSDQTFWQMVGSPDNKATLASHSYRSRLGPSVTLPFENSSVVPVKTLQELCANTLSYGNPFINAGGYCHRERTGPFADTSDVWFSDEMTPHSNLTWDNFRKSAAIRFLCWNKCRCKNPSLKGGERPMAALWQLTASTSIGEVFEDNAVLSSFGSTQPGRRPRSQRKVGLPNRYKTNTCDTEDAATCTDGPWPVELLGPRPSTPVTVPTTILDTCGGECRSNQECSSSADGECRCIVPKPSLIPLDPVFPALPLPEPGRCLSLNQDLLTKMSQFHLGLASGSLLGKRDDTDEAVDLSAAELGALASATWVANITNGTSLPFTDAPTPDAVAEEWAMSNITTVWYNETTLIDYGDAAYLASYLFCVCNCTYTSLACCDASDGIVFEPPHANRGSIPNCANHSSWTDIISNDVNGGLRPSVAFPSNVSASSSVAPLGSSSVAALANGSTNTNSLPSCPIQGHICWGSWGCGGDDSCWCGAFKSDAWVSKCYQSINIGSSTPTANLQPDVGDGGAFSKRAAAPSAIVNAGLGYAAPTIVEQSMVCACNCTFMSTACCGRAAGLVEAGTPNVSPVQLPAAMCCDGKTGDARHDQRVSTNSTMCPD